MDNQKRPLVLGHRGASYLKLDNSRDAFEAAVSEKADGVELDVRATSDGILAVIHDPAIKGFGAVVEHTFDNVNRATGFELLRLEQALEILEGMFIDIEIKSDPKEAGWVPSELTSRLLAKFLSGYETKSTLVVTSFSERAVQVFSDLAPDVPIGLLGNIGSDFVSRCHAAREMGANYVLPHHSCIDSRTVKEAHDLGLGVIVWTVDSRERISAMARCHVDGIITNRVDVALSVLDVDI